MKLLIIITIDNYYYSPIIGKLSTINSPTGKVLVTIVTIIPVTSRGDVATISFRNSQQKHDKQKRVRLTAIEILGSRLPFHQ